MDNWKRDVLGIFGVAAVFLMLSLLAFSAESFAVVLRFTFAVFWIFLLPGYFLTLCFRNTFGFWARFGLGAGLNLAAVIVLSYGLSNLGLHFRWHPFVLPLVIMLSGIALAYYAPTAVVRWLLDPLDLSAAAKSSRPARSTRRGR